MANSQLEEAFARTWGLCAKDAPAPVREFTFAPPRRFRFDFAWPEQKLAVEIQGGQWNLGRHNRGGGSAKDNEKGNLAILHGWRVLKYATDDIKKRPIQVVEEVIKALKGVL